MTAPTALPNSAIAGRHSSKDKTAYGLAEAAFQQSSLSVLDKLENFPRFSTKRALARFMAKE
ncbi:hypothetical protein DFO50_1424, partial [Microvirgula sp. AG722]